MSKLLDKGGAPLTVVITDVKKDHDPAELHRERVRLNNLLHKACADFVNDLQAPPDVPEVIMVDRAKVIAHHDAKWRDLARVMNASSFPHPVDEEALMDQITAMSAEEQKAKDMATPIAQLTDPARFDLHLVGETLEGKVYINTRVALCVSQYGQVKVWVRNRGEEGDLWCNGWLPMPQRPVLLEAQDYTLGELYRLLAAMRISKVSRLTDTQMAQCAMPPKKGYFR